MIHDEVMESAENAKKEKTAKGRSVVQASTEKVKQPRKRKV
jgi:hypothetical protein